MDSSADIGYVLRDLGAFVGPVANPRVEVDADWCFPDTSAGIEEALDRGAEIFWANTVLFDDHPLSGFSGRGLKCVGQHWSRHLKYEDKFETRELIGSDFLPWAQMLYSASAPERTSLEWKSQQFPLVVKPRFGRGSEGVRVCKDVDEVIEWSEQLFGMKKYGDGVILEEFLKGQEITISVLPPSLASRLNLSSSSSSPFALPVVERTNHTNGVMPYNGDIPVAHNSTTIPTTPLHLPVLQETQRLTALFQARSIVRFDARFSSKHNNFKIFDINLKPNATGPARPHRRDQSSLVLLALAQQLNTTPEIAFKTLVQAQIDDAWTI